MFALLFVLASFFPQQQSYSTDLIPSTLTLTSQQGDYYASGSIPGASAWAQHVDVSVHVQVQHGLLYSFENLSNQPISGYSGLFGGYIETQIGDIYGPQAGVSFWHSVCGGRSRTAFDGQLDGHGSSGITAQNIFPFSGDDTISYGYIPPQMQQATVPISIHLNSTNYITSSQSFFANSAIRGSGVQATLTVTYW